MLKRLMRYFLFVILMLIIPSFARSQHLTGRVVDKDSIAIASANVSILRSDSTFIEGVITDSNGNFRFDHSIGHAAFIRVSSVGYITKIVDAFIESECRIVLQENKIMLGEVVVKSKRPKYKHIHGGYSIPIKNSILEKLNNADEILSSLPRVNGDNGNFTIFGKGAPVIYINNRKISDKSELRLLKPNDIEKVTVLTNHDEKYDSEFKSVIIIKTKREQGYGLSGGIEGDYYQSLKAGYNTMSNLNWRTRRWDIFGGINHSNVYGYNTQESEQEIIGNTNVISEKLTDFKRSNRSKDITGNLGFNYLINDSNSIGLQYHLYKDLKSQYSRMNYIDLLSINNNPDENIEYSMTANPNNGPTHELNGYYSGKINKFNISFDGTYFRKKSYNEMLTTEISANDSRDINSTKGSSSHYYAAKLVAERKILSDLSLSFGTEYYNSQIEQSYINKEGVIPSTNNLIKENNLAEFVSIDYTFGDFDLSTGLRYEHINNSVYNDKVKNEGESRTYNKFFPNVDFSYNGDSFNLGLSYAVTSTRPSYGDLSSIVAYDSRYLYEGGNPSLRMTIEHDIELSATYKDLLLSLSYEVEKNPIVKWGKLYNTTDDIILLTNINIPTQKYLTFTLSASPTFSFWHPMLEVDFQKQYIDNRGLNHYFNKPFWQFVFNNKLMLKHDFLFGANYIFRTAGADGYTFANGYQKLDIFISKYFCKRKLYLKFQLEDIFKSTKSVNEMYTDNYNIKQTTWPTCRNAIFTIGYNFNHTRKRYSGTGAGVEEKNRL
jgi:hypothetical protein